MTPKQQAFVREYLVDLNATQAAIRAGYSERTAAQIGSENLEKPEIAGAIERAIKERSDRLSISQDDVIRGLQGEAGYRGPGASHGARVSAWTQLGRHLGMFSDKLTLDGPAWLHAVARLTPEQVRRTERMSDAELQAWVANLENGS